MISKLYLLLSTTVFVNDYILALSSEDYFRSSFVSWPIVQREKEREKREMATTTYHSMINFSAPRLADSQQFAVNQRNTGLGYPKGSSEEKGTISLRQKVINDQDLEMKFFLTCLALIHT